MGAEAEPVHATHVLVTVSANGADIDGHVDTHVLVPGSKVGFVESKAEHVTHILDTVL